MSSLVCCRVRSTQRHVLHRSCVNLVSMVAAARWCPFPFELCHCYRAKQSTSDEVSSSCDSPSQGIYDSAWPVGSSLREAKGISNTCQGAGLELQGTGSLVSPIQAWLHDLPDFSAPSSLKLSSVFSTYFPMTSTVTGCPLCARHHARMWMIQNWMQQAALLKQRQTRGSHHLC